MHQLNLKNIEHIDNYIKLLMRIEDNSFVELNNIEKMDRELRENDEWKDQVHDRFTNQYILSIQNNTFALQRTLYESIQELKNIRNIYSQII